MTSSHSSADENFGAAAGNAVETGANQSRDDLRYWQPRQAREMNHLGRRQRMQLEVGVPCFDRAKQIFVPLEWEIGIVSTLQQELDAADCNRFVDLAEDLVEA